MITEVKSFLYGITVLFFSLVTVVSATSTLFSLYNFNFVNAFSFAAIAVIFLSWTRSMYEKYEGSAEEQTPALGEEELAIVYATPTMFSFFTKKEMFAVLKRSFPTEARGKSNWTKADVFTLYTKLYNTAHGLPVAEELVVEKSGPVVVGPMLSYVPRNPVDLGN